MFGIPASVVCTQNVMTVTCLSYQAYICSSLMQWRSRFEKRSTRCPPKYFPRWVTVNQQFTLLDKHALMCILQLLLRKQLLYRNRRSRKNSRAKTNTDIFWDSNSLGHDGGDGKKGIFKFLNINKQHENFRNINTVNTTSWFWAVWTNKNATDTFHLPQEFCYIAKIKFFKLLLCLI